MEEQPLRPRPELEVEAAVSVVVDPVGEEHLVFKLAEPRGLRHVDEGPPESVLEEGDAVAATDEELRSPVRVEVPPETEEGVVDLGESQLLGALSEATTT